VVRRRLSLFFSPGQSAPGVLVQQP